MKYPNRCNLDNFDEEVLASMDAIIIDTLITEKFMKSEINKKLVKNPIMRLIYLVSLLKKTNKHR